MPIDPTDQRRSVYLKTDADGKVTRALHGDCSADEEAERAHVI